VTVSGRGKMVIQVSVWKDKKLVGNLHDNAMDEPNGNNAVQRYCKKAQANTGTPMPPAGPEYSKYTNGANRRDRDTQLTGQCHCILHATIYGFSFLGV
jgi:hypothetical protein